MFILSWRESYQEYKVIGKGSFGTVYELFVNGVSQGQVVKECIEETNFKDYRRFLREIDILLKLGGHKNIINIIQHSKNVELPWFSMPKANDTLHHYIKNRSEPISEEEALLYLDMILDALDYAHQNDILHRDLAPSNILLFESHDSEYMEVKVADFSLGRDYTSESVPLTKTVDIRLGQEAFVAPEQFEKISQTTVQSDIYSVGALLAFMLTQRDPRLYKPSGTIRIIIDKCMDIDPNRRPHDIIRLKEMVDGYKKLTTKLLPRNMEEIKAEFGRYNLLNFEYRDDLTTHLLKYDEYTHGSGTFLYYFKPIIYINSNLIAYWSQKADIYSVHKFVENYCKQMKIINQQKGWNFKTAEKIGDVILNVFFSISNIETRVLIFKTIIECRDGFPELSRHLKELMSGVYEDKEVYHYSMMLFEYKEALKNYRNDFEDSLRHHSFHLIINDI